MKNAITKEQILRICHNSKEACWQILNKFHSTFLENPFYSFEWSDCEMKAAARLRVANSVIHALEGETKATTDSVIHYYKKEILKRAKSVTSRSTSSASTFMNLAYTEAMADFLDSVEDLI